MIRTMIDFRYRVRSPQVPLYIDAGRDCEAAQGPSCTRTEPCTPCDLEKLMVISSTILHDPKGSEQFVMGCPGCQTV